MTSTRRAALPVAATLAVACLLAPAMSRRALPAGSEIAGIDVSGLTAADARAMLKQRSRELGRVPVVFTANGKRWRVKPDAVVAEVDWAAAVEAARQQGEGFGPIRGLKRLGVRVFGGEVAPRATVYQTAINSYVARFGQAVDHPRAEPYLRLRGAEPEVVPGQAGMLLDRSEAQRVLVRALTGLSREPVPLPLRADRPHLATADLAGAKVKAETALSAPVDLAYENRGSWHLTRAKIGRLLALPRNGSTELELAGPLAPHFFGNLRRRVGHPPRNATFRIGAGNRVRVVAAQAGRRVDVAATKHNLLLAMLSSSNRRADLAVISAAPERTTGEARAMGITGLVGAYETFYGGVPNRIHNVQLVAHLIDDHFIAPGEEFTFNGTTGERTSDKGFLEAPVIINGELKTGLGGGICQVSTTTFNAAYDAGLSITERTNHALYISHYPLGRDATVNYPDTDLKFENDTGHWLWLRTFVGSSSLTVALYGTPSTDASRARSPRWSSPASRPSRGCRTRISWSARRRSRSTGRPRARRTCAAASTRRTGSCCTTTRGTPRTLPSRVSFALGRSPSRRRSRPSRRRRRRPWSLLQWSLLLRRRLPRGLSLGDRLGQPGGYPRGPMVADRDGRAGHRPSRRVPRLVRDDEDRVPAPVPRRLPRPARGRGRRPDARGARAVPRAPRGFDDRLTIRARCSDVRGARFRFDYSVERDGSQVADGWTTHACVSVGDHRPTRVPAWLAEAIAEAEA